MSVSETNKRRFRVVLISRDVRSIFGGVPERFAWIVNPLGKWALRRFLLRAVLRWLFLAEDGTPHRAGEVVLAHLRSRTGHGRYSIFDPDPHVLAYREGQRAAVMEIINLLNLDEGSVQKLMELDDGLE